MISQTICLIFSSLRGLLFQDIKRKNVNEIILIIMKKLLRRYNEETKFSVTPSFVLMTL